VRIQVQIPHHLAEDVPLGLRKGQTDVLVGEQEMFVAAGFVERSVHDPLGRLSHLVLRNVEVFHGRLPIVAPVTDDDTRLYLQQEAGQLRQPSAPAKGREKQEGNAGGSTARAAPWEQDAAL
jgi:hypothetical protein